MVELIKNGVYLLNGTELVPAENMASGSQSFFDKAGMAPVELDPKAQAKGTMAARIIAAHNVSEDENNLELVFDALTSHDITYVGIVQTAIASGLKEFPVPYVLTNCHNSLAAVGGTINEDDHVFGLTAAQKFGGDYVPAHLAVIHQYMREMKAGGGKMILGSDSHTRYGALGTMAVGEGGPELVKQLLKKTYRMARPGVIAIYLKGKPRHGVGPQDVALTIEKAVFANGFVKNKVMEFVGPGIASLSMDFRNGVDVMTTETTCWSSIWCTDETTKKFLTVHGRPSDYKEVKPEAVAYYDGAVVVDLSEVVPMIAMPFHPSNVFTIEEINANGKTLLPEIEAAAVAQLDNKNLKLNLLEKYYDGKLHVDQGIIVGCSGGLYENVALAANILKDNSVGTGRFAFSVYPSSHPIYLQLMRDGSLVDLMEAGTVVRTAFCGPCFGAGDTPNNTGLSVRHATRNFPNREGSKPGNGQISSVALMDSRSIAATARNGGVLTAATEIEYDDRVGEYAFDPKPYNNRVYKGFGTPNPAEDVVYGPAIKAWPTIAPLQDNLLVKLAAVIHDPVTTTDELIPSGETSSFRSDPYALSEFTLSRKVPEYVGRSKESRAVEAERLQNGADGEGVVAVFEEVAKAIAGTDAKTLAATTNFGSAIFANKPGDGSAREQAASCQRVLGGAANFALEYATKRYRSNVINWGMLPFLMHEQDVALLDVGEYVFVPNVRDVLLGNVDSFKAYVIADGKANEITLAIGDMSQEEKEIIASGCLINFYASQK